MPVAPPLDASSTYLFDDASEFAEASAARTGKGYVYARWANPTVDAFEAAVADLEGTEDAEAFASGMAAISAIFLALCSPGNRIVAARQLYGNTYSLLRDRLPSLGITTTFCDVDDYDALAAAVDADTKLVYCETIGNPRIQVADLAQVGEIANAAGLPLVVDNTFASPVLCRPAELGAAYVVHSATKWIGGHHDLVGGIVCAGTDALDPLKKLARDIGPTLSPFTAWLALRGLSTIHLRVHRASQTAAALAQLLSMHPDIERLYYPTLGPDAAIADRILGGWGGGIIGLEVRGGKERTRRFTQELELIGSAASLGGTHSLIVHSASVTHTQLSAQELAAAGISEGFCRLSVGIEDQEDLMLDLETALAKSA